MALEPHVLRVAVPPPKTAIGVLLDACFAAERTATEYRDTAAHFRERAEKAELAASECDALAASCRQLADQASETKLADGPSGADA